MLEHRPTKPGAACSNQAGCAGFWDKVDRSAGPNACWPWTGIVRADGYGIWQLSRPDARDLGVHRNQRAHRVALASRIGDLPATAVVCHRCDNPPCCNPAHLFLGTQAENLADCHRKQRHRFGDRHHAAQLTPEQVLALRAGRPVRGRVSALARRFGISVQTAWDAAAGKTYRHIQPAVQS